MNRHILHLRVDGFPVAVERLRDASLRNRPVVICARHSPRSLIFSASPEARKEGIREGLPLTKALRRCRGLVVCPPDEDMYRKASGEISRVLEGYSPLVESGHWGRFYVDMTGTRRIFGDVQDSAFSIRSGVRDSVGLEGTLGIGSNKLVSGVAARVVETHGDLYAVPSGSEASFLAPLRVRMLPAVRVRKDRTMLEEFNIRIVRQLASLSILQLTSVFGKRGVLLHRQALGIDESPVRPPASKPFVLEEKTLDEDTNDDDVLLGVLFGMMAGIVAGVLLILIGQNSQWPVSQEFLLQISWIMYGALIGAAAGMAKKKAMRVLLSLALGLSGGTACFLMLKSLRGLTLLQGIDPIYYTLLCAITVGAFIGVSNGIYEKSLRYSMRCIGWAIVGSGLAAVTLYGAQFLPALYLWPFLSWIVIGAALGFFLNYFVGLARKPA